MIIGPIIRENEILTTGLGGTVEREKEEEGREDEIKFSR